MRPATILALAVIALAAGVLTLGGCGGSDDREAEPDGQPALRAEEPPAETAGTRAQILACIARHGVTIVPGAGTPQVPRAQLREAVEACESLIRPALLARIRGMAGS